MKKFLLTVGLMTAVSFSVAQAGEEWGTAPQRRQGLLALKAVGGADAYLTEALAAEITKAAKISDHGGKYRKYLMVEFQRVKDSAGVAAENAGLLGLFGEAVEVTLKLEGDAAAKGAVLRTHVTDMSADDSAKIKDVFAAVVAQKLTEENLVSTVLKDLAAHVGAARDIAQAIIGAGTPANADAATFSAALRTVAHDALKNLYNKTGADGGIDPTWITVGKDANNAPVAFYTFDAIKTGFGSGDAFATDFLDAPAADSTVSVKERVAELATAAGEKVTVEKASEAGRILNGLEAGSEDLYFAHLALKMYNGLNKFDQRIVGGSEAGVLNHINGTNGKDAVTLPIMADSALFRNTIALTLADEHKAAAGRDDSIAEELATYGPEALHQMGVMSASYTDDADGSVDEGEPGDVDSDTE